VRKKYSRKELLELIKEAIDHIGEDTRLNQLKRLVNIYV